ncbi:MAG: cation:proton antiporter [Panacagrimonas sp.]
MPPDPAPWYLGAGLLLTAIAVLGSRVARWPMSTAMIYMVIGAGLGLAGAIDLGLPSDARVLEIASEIAVILSLFSVGLRLRLPAKRRRWLPPVLLATVGMMVTIGLVSIGAMWLLGLSFPLALVLGAILAPTDPVLAADVQVGDVHDRDRLRITLTGEAGINDGMAFPFLLLGLGLLVDGKELDLLHWLAVDVLWKIGAGAVVGTALGWVVCAGVLRQRRKHHEAVGFDDFLALGLIAVSYGAALLIHAYGFIAVFAAGLALRALERQQSEEDPAAHKAALAALPETKVASDPRHAPAFLAEAVLRFNSQMDRIGELALVIAVGILLVRHPPTMPALALAVFLIAGARPLAVAPLCALCGLTLHQTRLTAWFGIRGIGSIYYLMFALNNGDEFAPEQVSTLVSATLTAIALSTLLHGISATPLMRRYHVRSGGSARQGHPPSRR